MAKKRYSILQRLNFHKNRVQNSNVSVNKKGYSLNWLYGYNDPYAENNYRAVCSEIAYKRQHKSLTKAQRIVLYGYRNGLKANLDSKKNNK